ncbi:hypothetical protein A1O1_01465 [Capronia coronata CBS 617.96]|uniref:Uncharacterized protein n=1 Tax=Capronia coronata CBS 617.96 TaxID=1182541 RepID=W9ZPF4_9EURO|nr:uncharacterized protein A1O1_01465 [Capronia coronata CBS 617.96]EXJ96339.1 hypothetical protein A1O1_01465 [Capronia coronata CBS 617.96]
MADQQRFFGETFDNVSLRSTFGGKHESERMKLLRGKIQQVRQHWATKETYEELTRIVGEYCKLGNRPKQVRSVVSRLLSGFHDFVDMDRGPNHLSNAAAQEQYDALELYCSAQGYTYLFGVMATALRASDPHDDLLLTATALTEYLTIDLYNLRLSQIGDPQYANFQGVTYRGLRIPQAMLEEYEQIMARPNLAERNFAVPLALLSSSTDERIMQTFAAPTAKESQLVRMHWTIHIHGLDPDLLRAYRRRYPNSVVTSICAMPVGRISPIGEKEVLLRGAFFQLIAIESETHNDIQIVNLVVAMINANRDHGSEHASDEGEKQSQRAAFNRIVAASKFEVCSRLSEQYSESDAKEYKELQRQRLVEVRKEDDINVSLNADLADARSSKVAVWVGGALVDSYPRHYASLRRKWQHALHKGRWKDAQEILAREYDWKRREWFNVGKLHVKNEDVVGENLSLLHELVNQTDLHEGKLAYWDELMHEAEKPDVWSEFKSNNLGFLRYGDDNVLTGLTQHQESLRSFDAAAKTAEEMARDNGLFEIADRLRPKFVHEFVPHVLAKLETQLHQTMKEKAGDLVSFTTVGVHIHHNWQARIS